MFCDYCGVEIDRKASACPECGRRMAPFRALPPVAALENHRSQWVAYSRIRLYGGLLLSLHLLGWLYLIGSAMEQVNRAGRGRPLENPIPFDFGFGVLFFIGFLGIVWAIVGFIGARAIAEETPAGRQRASLMAAILLLDVPFGTVLGIVILRAIARVNELQAAKPLAKSQ